MSALRRFVPVVLLMTAVMWGPALAGSPASGLQRGEAVEPWNPVHVAGPDRGTTNCPVCTYLERPGVVVFAKDGPEVSSLAARLERLVAGHQEKELKGFLAVLDAGHERLKRIAAEAKVARSGLCGLNPKTRDKELRAYKVNPNAGITIIIYKDYTVVATFVNLPAKDFGKVEEVVNSLLK